MLILISSDNQATSTRLRHALSQYGHECPLSNVVSVERSVEMLDATDRHPALILFVLPENLDLALARLQQLASNTSSKLIAIGPADDPVRILSVVHAGAQDYLDESGDLHQQLAAALTRLHTKHEPLAPIGRLTVVTSASGGSGVSTVAANLAAIFAAQSETCGLLDLDLSNGDQPALFNVKPRHSIADLCRHPHNVDQNMLEQSLTRHDSGVRILAAPQRMAEVEQLTPDGIRKIMQLCRSAFSELVVDFPDACDRRKTGLLQAADSILVVFRMEFPAVRRLRRLLDHWDEMGINQTHVYLTANRYGQPKELPTAKVANALRKKIFHFLPDDARRCNLSVNCGMPVSLEAPRSGIARSLCDLARKLESARQPGVASQPVAAPVNDLLSKLPSAMRNAVRLLNPRPT